MGCWEEFALHLFVPFRECLGPIDPLIMLPLPHLGAAPDVLVAVAVDHQLPLQVDPQLPCN